jgi:hypothetical protein
MAATDRESLFPYLFATWVFSLHVGGVDAHHEGIASACRDARSATDEAAGNAAGERLVALIRDQLKGTGADEVTALTRTLFGDRVRTDLGDGSRADRLGRIRRYQFGTGLPWLARFWERGSDGNVSPTWILVERMTDVVHAMDPNPWNDIDEDRSFPVDDFQVLWELEACASVAVGA